MRVLEVWGAVLFSSVAAAAYPGCSTAGTGTPFGSGGGDSTSGTASGSGSTGSLSSTGSQTTGTASTGSQTTGTASTGSQTTGTASTGSQTTGATSTTAGTGGTTGAGGQAGSGGAGTGGAVGAGGGGGVILSDGGTVKAVVYGESPTTLYRVNPITKEVTDVGDFVDCGGAVTDIAVNKAGAMYGTTFGSVVSIDPATAICTTIAIGCGYPNSLSFVPAGTLDPNVEALVGYNGSTYVRIDEVTGVMTTVGSLGCNGLSSSGDMVAVIGGDAYLTVNGIAPNGTVCSDCIVQVDPKTGTMINMIGPVGHESVYGLAYWAGVAYGFDLGGELFSIDLTNGASTTIPIPNAPPGLQFYGAGSTTNAPMH